MESAPADARDYNRREYASPSRAGTARAGSELATRQLAESPRVVMATFRRTDFAA